MSAETAAPPVTGQANAILREVMEARWPESREAQKAIGYLADRAAECRDIYGRLAGGDMDPLSVPAPDKGWWADPLECALEWAADEFREAARAARKRLAEYQRREREATERAREWMSL